jgi:Glyoxalase-like domain
MAVARTGFVSLDCADPLALGEFWAAMLGGEIAFSRESTVGVRTDWVWLSAMKIDDYVAPTWPDNAVPKQIHLDPAGHPFCLTTQIPREAL